MIGVFDSGFGGLTVWRALVERLPAYDYYYLGDSARAPYGPRSFAAVAEFTREAVEYLFAVGCPLVILACNTASARALRRLQQEHLPRHRPDRRILGVIRPSAEALAGLPPGALPGITAPGSARGTVAVLGTRGTIASNAYGVELGHLAPGLNVIQQACPLWVPLVEAGELDGPGVDYYLRRYLEPLFARPLPPERILLGCTHYPLLLPSLRRHVPAEVALLAQGELVAERLQTWLERHPEIERRLGRRGQRTFATTDDPVWFAEQSARVLGADVTVETARLHPFTQ